MTDSSLPIGVILLILLGFGVVIYYLSKLEEKFTTHRHEKLELESLNISKELDSVADLINNDPTVKIQILGNVSLVETRISQGKQSLKVIDSNGALLADCDELAFIGAHRRMVWKWNKIIQVIGNRQSEDRKFVLFETGWEYFLPVKKSMQNIILPVSNRQRNSGLHFQTTNEVREKIISLVEHFIEKSDNKVSPKKDTGKNNSNPNIIVNINQTITDSVVQGNLTNIDQLE